MATAFDRLPAGEVPRERGSFTSLLAQNPNYFGNLPDSPFPVQLELIGNVSFEELTCVSYNPDRRVLEATISIKRPTGYLGNLCATGSREYIRFFVDDGAGFKDAGLAGIEVHDIPSGADCAGDPRLPLSYVATLPIQPRTDRCRTPILPLVRAILSWQVIPPAGDSNAGWQPVWGNVLECHVQIKPRRFIIDDLIPLFTEELVKKVKLPPDFALTLPPELETAATAPVPLPGPPPLSLQELAALYPERVREAVPPHRFGLADIHATVGTGALGQDVILAKAADFSQLGLDWSAVLAALDETQADVSYEELECVGLDNNVDQLVATFRVKRPLGYSGGPCTRGSNEYIAFWADWTNSCQFVHLATVAVNVHDISPLPDGGLCYAAVLPVDLSQVRRNCQEPVIGRIRAVLSWNVPPSTMDPDALTTWGNRVDVHVQVRPGVVAQATQIDIIGGIPVTEIDTNPSTGSGMTFPTAHFAAWGSPADDTLLNRPCPFGGQIKIQGAPPLLGWHYQVQVQLEGQPAWTGLVTPFVRVNSGGSGLVQGPDPDGFFPFLAFTDNIESMLALWNSSGDDLWRVRLVLRDPAGVLTFGPELRVQLDNTAPAIDIHIDSAGDCKTFTKGTVLQGHFVAQDLHFGHYSLFTLPFPGPVVPSGGKFPTAPAPGDQWTLDTQNMDPCGYVVALEAWDRSIVGSAPGLHNGAGPKAVGFCLEEPTS
jgi:hypothetical protein